VAIHYNLANTLKLNNSVRTTNDPLLGDIVFFSNTTGPGHTLNHEGIVVTAPNAQGMVQFVDATGSEDVHLSQMNILMPTANSISNPANGNSYIGSFCPPGAGNPCLAAPLFVGYGTIRDTTPAH
jgi:hypothetical protein